MTKAVLGDRALFPDLSSLAYLAHAAISPLSTPVCDRIRQVTASYAQGGMRGSTESAPLLEEVRQSLAALIGASVDEVGFVPNTTAGVIDIAFGLRWKPGDRVVLFDGEFPANVTPWQRAAEAFDLELAWLPLEPFSRAQEEGLSELESMLARGARLVAVSAVQYKTGLRMPVEQMAALCHRYGAELFVDGVQALGATPLDVSGGIDYLSCGSHKHLMGPEGAGFLYVAARCADACHPRLAGWLSHENAMDFLVADEPVLRYDKPFKRGAKAFEIGTSNAVGIAALGASVELLRQLGGGSVHRHVNAYLDALEAGLLERGFVSHRPQEPSSRSTLLSLQPPVGVRLLARSLARRGVVCTTPDGLLRCAPHWPNHPDEVPLVLAAFDEALAEVRR